jgi:hypothetical protein
MKAAKKYNQAQSIKALEQTVIMIWNVVKQQGEELQKLKGDDKAE